MIIGRSGFNIYLLCLVAMLTAVCGCQSTERRQAKRIATLAVHLEVMPDFMDFSKQVSVFRDKPLAVHIDKSPFLTEAQVSSASVVEDQDGWMLQVEFERRGAALLEQYTTINPGRHLVIFSTFGKDKQEGRWLAAPLINRRISNGVLRFTPDASREEAEEIVFGLNNLARQVAEKSKW